MLSVAAACGWQAPLVVPAGVDVAKEQGPDRRDQPASQQGANAGDVISRADRFFEEGQLDAALSLYTKVVAAQDPALQSYARYKAAWCHINLSQDRAALEQFVAVIRLAAESPNDPQAARLAQVARQDIVLPYSRIGQPSRAWDFFYRIAPAEAPQMLERLAATYDDQGQFQNAVTIYRILMTRLPATDRLCLYQTRVAESVRAVGRRPDQVDELGRTMDLMNAFVAGDHPAETESTCRLEVAQLVLETATTWYREALGSQAAPGTLDRETMSQAARLYSRVLDSFSDLDQLPLSGWSPTTRPTQARVRQWLAELEQHGAAHGP
jgi:tetratricopeptide (TPR) repeat protein